MDKKAVSNYRARIKRAQSTLSCFGDMLLQLEIDNMSQEQRLELQAALLASRAPLSYKYLDAKIHADRAVI